MLNNFVNKHIRDAAELTTSYVASTVIDDAYTYNQLEILANWTKLNSTSLELKVEFSVDGTNHYQEQDVVSSNGVSTVYPNSYTTTQATGKFQISVPISTRYILVSAKCTGTATGTSLTLDAILHTV